MKKMIIVLLLIVAATPLVIYVASEVKLRSYQEPTTFQADILMDQPTLERGQYAMRIRGCFSCHGEKLQGKVFENKWSWVNRAVAPNLAEYAKKNDVSVIEKAIRHGIGVEGKALWAMPSFGFTNLSDADLVAMIAYMRQVETVNGELAKPSLGWHARWLLISNQMKHSAALSSQVPALQLDDNEQPHLARGEYLAMSICNECHGRDLNGEESLGDSFPNLMVMIKAYNQQDFIRLMSKGIGLGGRADLGLMTYVAKTRFAHLTDQDVSALYSYLQSISD